MFYSAIYYCSILLFAKDDFKFGESETILCFDYLGQIRKLQKLVARTRTKFAKQSVDL